MLLFWHGLTVSRTRILIAKESVNVTRHFWFFSDIGYIAVYWWVTPNSSAKFYRNDHRNSRTDIFEKVYAFVDNDSAMPIVHIYSIYDSDVMAPHAGSPTVNLYNSTKDII